MRRRSSVPHGALTQYQRGIARCSLACGTPCGDKRGTQATTESQRELRGRDLETLDAHQRVERGNGLTHRSREQNRQRPCQSNPENSAEKSTNETFAEKQAHDLGFRGSTGTKHANLAPTPDHSGGEAVVDQVNPHHHRDETERGEIELESRQHALGFAPTAGRRADDCVGWRDRAEFLDDRIELERVFRHHLDRSKATLQAEELLGPADIHHRQSRIGGHSDIVGFQFKNRTEDFRGPVCEDAKGFFPLPGEGEDIGFAEPFLKIQIPAVPRGEFKNPHIRAGEGIDAKNPQILPGLFGHRGDSLHQRGGGGDAIGFSHRRKYPFGKVATNLQVGATCDQSHGVLKARESAAVRHLDREKNRHACRNAQNVDRGEKRMSQRRTDDLAPEKTGKLGSHSEDFTAAPWRTFWRLRIAEREVIFPPSRP